MMSQFIGCEFEFERWFQPVSCHSLAAHAAADFQRKPDGASQDAAPLVSSAAFAAAQGVAELFVVKF